MIQYNSIEKQKRTYEKLLSIAGDQSPTLIEPLEAFENSLKQSHTQQRVRTSHGTTRAAHRPGSQTATP